jgi:hypothetical protein
MKSKDRADALTLFKHAREKLKNMEFQLHTFRSDVDWLISVLEEPEVKDNDQNKV